MDPGGGSLLGLYDLRQYQRTWGMGHRQMQQRGPVISIHLRGADSCEHGLMRPLCLQRRHVFRLFRWLVQQGLPSLRLRLQGGQPLVLLATDSDAMLQEARAAADESGLLPEQLV